MFWIVNPNLLVALVQHGKPKTVVFLQVVVHLIFSF